MEHGARNGCSGCNVVPKLKWWKVMWAALRRLLKPADPGDHRPITVALRYTSVIDPPLPTEGDGDYRLTHPNIGEIEHIEVRIGRDGAVIVVSAQLSGHDEVLAALALSDVPPSVEATLSNQFSRLYEVRESVFALLVQELRMYDRHHITRTQQEWSRDGADWRLLHPKISITRGMMYPVFRLDSAWTQHLQYLIGLGEQPFFATQHLHEARRGNRDRMVWIEATLAAELAIKEALIRLEPKFSVLLLELPAPPLTTLYGPVLQALTGQRSPFLKSLGEGIRIRNRLIHRPLEPDPEPQKLADYVSAVDGALRHLRRLCREQNPAISIDQLHPHVQWDHPGAG